MRIFLKDIPDIPIINMPSEAVTGTQFPFYEEWLLKVDVLDMLGLNVESNGLFSWYSPASWYRIGLEFMHNHFDLPWFASIICSKHFDVLIRFKNLLLKFRSSNLISFFQSGKNGVKWL